MVMQILPVLGLPCEYYSGICEKWFSNCANLSYNALESRPSVTRKIYGIPSCTKPFLLRRE